MSSLQDYYKNLGKVNTQSKSLTSYYNTLAEQGKSQLYKAESTNSGIDQDLYKQLRDRGVGSTAVKEDLKPEKVSYLKTFGKVVKDTFGGLFGQMAKDVRATTQVLATIPAVGAAKSYGVSPLDAAKESLSMARDMLLNENISVDEGVSMAADRYLQNQQVGKYGGEPVQIRDVVALSALGFFNLFGDPVFETALGLRGAKALKEFATFKKVGAATKELEAGAKFVKGTQVSREIKITDDLKIKIKPKTNEVVFEGYKKRFSTQKSLPEGMLSPETSDLIKATRESTGMEMSAKFEGDNLILRATEPIQKSVQPIKTVDPLIQEAKKYKSAEEFIKKRMDYNGNFVNIGDTVEYETMWGAKKVKVIGTNSNGELNGKLLESFQVPPGISKTGVMKNGEVLELTSAYINQGIGDIDEMFARQRKTKSQLTDIWNKAQEKPIKPTKIARDIEAEAIEKGLTKGFEDIAGYEPRVIKEQSAKIAKIINTDLEKAKNMIKGSEPIPNDISGSYLIKAMEDYAFEKGDINLIQDLARSPLTAETSRYGSELRMLAERNPNNPVNVIKEINKARGAKVAKRKVRLTEEQKKINREIKAVKKSQKDLDDFINSIIC